MGSRGGGTLKSLIAAFVPRNYYAILFVTLMLISPYINRAIKGLSEPRLRSMIVLLVGLFSVFPTILDSGQFFLGFKYNDLSTIGRAGSAFGYSIVNFVLMYLVGAYLQVHRPTAENRKRYIARALVVWLILFLWGFFALKNWMDLNFPYSYCNPFVILFAVSVFQLFSTFELGCNAIINEIAAAVFTVYLTHGLFLSKLQIEVFAQKGPVIMLAHLILCCVVLYAIGYVTYKVWSALLGAFARVGWLNKIKSYTISAE